MTQTSPLHHFCIKTDAASDNFLTSCCSTQSTQSSLSGYLLFYIFPFCLSHRLTVYFQTTLLLLFLLMFFSLDNYTVCYCSCRVWQGMWLNTTRFCCFLFTFLFAFPFIFYCQECLKQ